MMQMAQRETTLGGLVRAADTLGLSLHVRLREKAPPAYRCRYCRSEMRVTSYVYDENPFCAGCLHERVARAVDVDPLDGPRMDCGLPVR